MLLSQPSTLLIKSTDDVELCLHWSAVALDGLYLFLASRFPLSGHCFRDVNAGPASLMFGEHALSKL